MLPTFSLRRFTKPAVLAGLAAAFFAFGSPATAFQLVPIAQDFEPSGRGVNQTFQVENDRDEQVTVTISMAERIMDTNGNESLKPTEDFTVFPTEIVLPPKGARVVRVKWIGDPAPTKELSYRIIAEETPLRVRRDTPGASLFLTIRYVGSVYIVPKGARPNVVVATARPVNGPQGQQLEVVLENKGTRHAVLDQPTLSITAGGARREVDRTAVDQAISGENILAQAQRRFLLPWPSGLVPSAQLQAEIKYLLQ